MKKLSDLKRDAENGSILFELIERFGESGNEIPERLRGVRTVDSVNTVAIMLKNSDGKTSELRIPPASLAEYTGDKLVIYSPGLRELNETEKALIDEWKEKESSLGEHVDGYWAKKRFFCLEHPQYKYLAGWDKQAGKRYCMTTNTVSDSKIKGTPILIYNIIRK